jgi:eukaryotic-like serine/threonine-protein kinase
VWSPDGAQIAFSRLTEGQTPYGRLYVKSVGAVEDEKSLLEGYIIPSDWSRDGQFIVYEVRDAKESGDLWVLPLTGDRKPRLLAGTEFHEQEGQFSPDGQWLAYSSDETGRFEVYTRSFPGLSTKWQISTGGGTRPRWRQDGRELFYLTPDKKLMAVKIRVGSRFEADVPRELFQAPLQNLASYVVAADGRRFLLSVPTEASPIPITVVLNWTATLKK